jgi:SsrA-binding protein
MGNRYNHEPTRERKLLLHKPEIRRLTGKLKEKGLTLVPLKMYFKDGKVKVLLGLGKGKAKYDKRQAIQKRESQREMQREMKKYR